MNSVLFSNAKLPCFDPTSPLVVTSLWNVAAALGWLPELAEFLPKLCPASATLLASALKQYEDSQCQMKEKEKAAASEH